jgi:hypothetical protein
VATSILQGSLAKQIDAAFKSSGIPITGTLKRNTGNTINSLGDVVPAWTEYTCRAFMDEYTAQYKLANGIPSEDIKCSIWGASLSVEPRIGDYVKLPGYSWVKVRQVRHDPAKALYDCQSFYVSGDPES